MATAFQDTAFQSNAFQIDGGAPATPLDPDEQFTVSVVAPTMRTAASSPSWGTSAASTLYEVKA